MLAVTSPFANNPRRAYLSVKNLAREYFQRKFSVYSPAQQAEAMLSAMAGLWQDCKRNWRKDRAVALSLASIALTVQTQITADWFNEVDAYRQELERAADRIQEAVRGTNEQEEGKDKLPGTP